MENDTITKPFNRTLFAKRLKEAMKQKGITQDTLAKMLGAKRQTIGKYLKGDDALPNVEKLYEISSILKISTDYLLGIQDIKSTDLDIQTIHNKTGLSEEAISSLQREAQMLKRLTKRENIDEALSEFIELRNSKLNQAYCPLGEFMDYAEEHGFADVKDILDYELNITPKDLIKFLPDAIVCNELMLGTNLKYTDKKNNEVMIALYDVISHRHKKAVYHFYEETDLYKDMGYVDFEDNNPMDDPDFDDYVDKENRRAAELGTEPLFNESEAFSMTTRGELNDEDIFAIKLLKLQQALTKRLENIKK